MLFIKRGEENRRAGYLLNGKLKIEN